MPAGPAQPLLLPQPKQALRHLLRALLRGLDGASGEQRPPIDDFCQLP